MKRTIITTFAAMALLTGCTTDSQLADCQTALSLSLEMMLDGAGDTLDVLSATEHILDGRVTSAVNVLDRVSRRTVTRTDRYRDVLRPLAEVCLEGLE